MTADTSKVISKVATVAITAGVTFLLSFSFIGFNAITKADAQAMIEKAEATHEAKMDMILSKLETIEVEQAKLDERIEALREATGHDGTH